MTLTEAFNQILAMRSRKNFDGLYDLLEALYDSAYDNGYEAAADWYEK